MNYLKPMVWSSIAVLALSMPISLLAADANVPVYNPPKRGAPAGRVGGGTRGGTQRDVFVLSVLAPDHSYTHGSARYSADSRDPASPSY